MKFNFPESRCNEIVDPFRRDSAGTYCFQLEGRFLRPRVTRKPTGTREKVRSMEHGGQSRKGLGKFGRRALPEMHFYHRVGRTVFAFGCTRGLNFNYGTGTGLITRNSAGFRAG